MTFKINKRTLIGFVGIILYRVLLDWNYFNIISPNFSYSGFIDNRTTSGLFISWILLILFYFLARHLIYTEQEGMSHVIVTLLFLLSFIPFTTCIYAGLTTNVFILCYLIYWFVLITSSKHLMRSSKKTYTKLSLNHIEINDTFVALVGLISFLVVVYISGRYAHFRLNFNLFNVYDLRMEAREYNMPTIFSYLFAWTKATNTIMFAYCLIKKKRIMAFLYFAIQMLSFGIDGSKTTFFLPFLVLLAVMFYGRITVGNLKLMICYGCAIGVLLAIMEYNFINSFYLSTLFVRRVLFVPNLLNIQYFDFFSANSPDYFRGSFLRLFGAKSLYESYGGVSRMIGRIYYSSATMNCNNGLFSDAISNLGYFGLIIMPIVLVFFLNLFDRTSSGLDKRLVLASGVYITINLISTSLTTVLVTHGFLLIILLTWIMKPENLNASDVTLNVN